MTSDSSVLDPDVQDPALDEGGHDKFTHIVRKGDLDKAWLGGEPIEALCGKRWIPTSDPDRFPVCGTCKEKLELILNSGSN